MQDKAVDRSNTLEKEIKEIYCGNLQVRRYLTLMLAESNGLLAAMANNLPLCHRLKPNGKHLIMQKCESREITIYAKQTQCGYEPHYENYTIGRDGYSLHPFQNCFWKDGIVNLNGQSYLWDNTKKEWLLQIPNYHITTIKLTSQFPELEDNELQYSLKHHKAFDLGEFEQSNVLNELVTRIQEGNAESLSSLIMNERVESNFWKLTGWTGNFRSVFIIIGTLFAILSATWVIYPFLSLRKERKRDNFTQLAFRLNEARRNKQNIKPIEQRI